MKKLTLTFALLLATTGLAFAEPCTWVTSPNSNVLMRTGDCDDGLTGGYFAASTVTEKGVTTTTYNGRPSEGPRTTVEIAAN